MKNPTPSIEERNPGAGDGAPGIFAVECCALGRTFPSRNGPVQALENISLSVRRGEIIVITGKSGAGKSTLLGLLAGLDSPTAGTVALAGRPLERISNAAIAKLRRDKAGIIFQDFNLLPSWTALENVEAPLMHSGVGRRVRRERVASLLQSLGLGDRLHHLPGELSVGQRQRVAVARALVNNPEIDFADEPAGGVDPETAQEIQDLLLRSVRERGATLIVATHGGFPLTVADRALALKNGTLA